MTAKTWLATALLAAAVVPVLSQTPALTQDSLVVAQEISGVIAAGTKVQFIKDGLDGTEGPIGLPDGSLLFTETNANRIIKVDKDNHLSIYMENTHGSNGLALGPMDQLISVQTSPARVGLLPNVSARPWNEAIPAISVDRFEEEPLVRPNDLVLDKKGGVYFTDPGAAVPAGQPVPPSTRSKTGVYYVSSMVTSGPIPGVLPARHLIRIADDVARPNGIMLSKNEKILYLANTWGEYILAFDVQDDGSVKNRRNFARIENVQKTATGIVSGADGLAIDDDDRLYVATVSGVQVFDRKGKHLGTIPIPRQPQNLAFAGPDKKTLYVVGRGAVYKIAMRSSGFKERAK